ncbi:MAG: hypothetical protein N4A61_12530 [Pelagimonas sp.]|nr:hypothetical protein [Pelagimonas sp.]
MTNPTRTAALGSLMIVQVIMLCSLYFQVPPHPPTTIPFGGMAPVIAAALCAAFSALVLDADSKAGAFMTVVACLLAAISYGPQKYFDPAISLVWPAVVTAQIAILTLLVPLVQALFGANDTATPSKCHP